MATTTQRIVDMIIGNVSVDTKRKHETKKERTLVDLSISARVEQIMLEKGHLKASK